MTGEKDKFKTHEQLWKLEDGELSTPQHDELVLQLLNKKNIDSMLDFLDIGYYESLFSYQTKEQVKNNLIGCVKNKLGDGESIKKDELNRLSELFNSLAEEYITKNETYINEDLQYHIFNTTISQIKSEVPVKSRNDFIIGYIDVQIEIKICDINSTFSLSTQYDINFTKTVHELSLMERLSQNIDPSHDEMVNYSGEIEGIIQTYLYIPKFAKYEGNLAWKNPKEDFTKINIEVKPKIKSFGETLRQINTYREFDRSAIYIIYSPDARFKEAFELQGIKFVTPKDIGINS